MEDVKGFRSGKAGRQEVMPALPVGNGWSEILTQFKVVNIEQLNLQAHNLTQLIQQEPVP